MSTPSKRPPAEWQRPTVYSIIILAVCIAALVWAAYAKVVGADKALFGGIGAIILWLTQGARRVMPDNTATVEIEPPDTLPSIDIDPNGGDK